MDNQPLDYDLDEPGGQFTQKAWQFASKGQRFANYMVDIIAYYMVYAAVAYLLLSGPESSGDSSLVMTTLWAPLAIFIGYFGLFEGATGGKTLGKFITQTRAVNADGSRLTMGTAFFRSICRMIPFEPLSIFFGDGFRMWHDSITKTQVVRD